MLSRRAPSRTRWSRRTNAGSDPSSDGIRASFRDDGLPPAAVDTSTPVATRGALKPRKTQVVRTTAHLWTSLLTAVS
jgi:hypothetical protein